jgi:predicted hydrocarbon binding protein
MTKKDIGQIRELEILVGQFAGEEARKKIMKGSEEIGKASPEKLAEWLTGVMDNLDALLDQETRTQIMENCGYNCAHMNRSHIERTVAKRRKFKSLDEFLEAEEKKPDKGTRLVRKEGVIHQVYTPSSFRKGLRCFCSLWRGLPTHATVSQTWCSCSKGFVQTLWEAVTEGPVEVELLESCISGAEECTFAIHLKNTEVNHGTT